MDTAKAEAKKQGKPVEIPSLHTENMTTVANPDGKTVGTYVYQAPIRFKNGHGAWQAIDTTLVRDGDVIKPKAIKDEVRLSTGGGTDLLTLITAQGKAQLGSPVKLPTPTLSGSTATYANAYGQGVDLLMQATPLGIRQQIVIRQRPDAPLTFRVPIETGGGLKYRVRSGKAEVTDEGKKVADLNPAVLLDAQADRSITDARVGAAATMIDGTDLVYTPDAKFLADPATQYPVTLIGDPTPWHGAGYPIDAFVATDDRFWGATVTQGMKLMVAGRSESGYLYRSYMKFDLSNAPFYGRTILNADTRPWNFITSDCGTSGADMVVRRVTSDWSMNTLRWTNQPATTTAGQSLKNSGLGRILGDTPEQDIYCSDDEGEIYYSIEGIVQDWADGQPNYGLQIAAYGENSGFTWRQYLTSEEDYDLGRPPVLFVEYEAPSAPPEVIVYSYEGPRRTIQPTYEEALAMRVDTPGDIPDLPAMSAEDEQALAAHPNHLAEISPAELEPFTGEDGEESWDGGTLEEGTPSDTVLPTVTDTVPAANASGVPADTPIKATFSEPVWDPNFSLKDSSGAAVEGSVTGDASQKTFTFTPAQQLKPGTTYTVEITEAFDASANSLAAYQWSFETRADGNAHWTFDEGTGKTAADSSGKHPATLNDTASWIAGKHGNAVSNAAVSPARVAASNEAIQNNQPVSVSDETTETSITYALPNGHSYRTEIAAGPVRTRQNGTWVPIDTRLTQQGNVLRGPNKMI